MLPGLWPHHNRSVQMLYLVAAYGLGLIAGCSSALPSPAFCLRRSDSDCSGQFCDFSVSPGAEPSKRCQCNEDGKDTCVLVGVCKPTPCSVCQACLSGMRDQSNLTTGSFDVARFTSNCPTELQRDPCSVCSGAQLPSTQASSQCDSIRTRYFPSSLTTTKPRPNAYFALRAGAVCTAMQRCVNLPDTCNLKVKSVVSPYNTNATGHLDLCTAEGVSSGVQLPFVRTGKQHSANPFLPA